MLIRSPLFIFSLPLTITSSSSRWSLLLSSYSIQSSAPEENWDASHSGIQFDETKYNSGRGGWEGEDEEGDGGNYKAI